VLIDLIVDLFGGPGGWDEAVRYILGLDNVVGVELNDAACATRWAAGHATWQQNVATVTDAQIAALPIEGLIGSPPCPAFSNAGNRGGIEDLEVLCDHARRCADGWLPLPAHEWEDRSSLLTLEPLRWALIARPTWVALEQVPPVLPIWRNVAQVLEANGYSVWCGRLNAADYGVPQTRTRAILMAHRHRPVGPPEPTHAKDPTPTLFGPELKPWVTMAQALGWGLTDGPASVLMASATKHGRSPLDASQWRRDQYAQAIAEGRFEVGFPRRDDLGTSEDGYRERDWRSGEEPAFAVTEKARSWMMRVPICGPRCGPVTHDPWSCEAASPRGAVPAREWGRGNWQAAVLAAAEIGRAVYRLLPGGAGYNDANRRLYELTEPAPTLGFGHDAAGWQWQQAERPVLNTGRDWKEGGDRGDAQQIDMAESPAPNLTAKGGTQWLIGSEETIQWTDRQPVIDGDTDNVPEGAEWTEGRPATTIAGDPRVPQPGSHTANDGRDNTKAVGRTEGAIRITPQQALVLQSFDPRYPVQGTNTKQFEQIGNAVPPLLAAPIVHELTKDLT
jgi:DNA (cytosine-5)-methyltransferase 1